MLLPASGHSRLIPCAAGAVEISDAITRIRGSIDPCGQTAQMLEVLDVVERCAMRTYRVCPDTAIGLNAFDRPPERKGEARPGTITWNPELRTELEPTCGGDPSAPVLRDPAASLLHELVHAAQDCAGLDPREHELEAVRIENIYRRAAGLCQRAAYGDAPLPRSMVKLCAPGTCPCSEPPDTVDAPLRAEARDIESPAADQPRGEFLRGSRGHSD